MGLIDGELRDVFGRRKLQSTIKKLKGRHIVCGIGRELGIIIAAIKGRTGQLQITPASGVLINPGDTLVAIGEASKLKALREMARKQ